MAGRLFLFLVLVVPSLISCSGNHSQSAPQIGAEADRRALFRAITSNELGKVKELVQSGVGLEAGLGEPGNEITPLIAATALGREQIAQYLIEKGASPFSRFRGYTPRDYSIRVFGDNHPISRELRTRGEF